MSWHKILAGALSGLLSAVVIDLHAWSEGDGSFDWPKALRRWIYGIFCGAAVAMGLHVAEGV